MPHFRFHLTDGAQRLEDTEGLELPGPAAAREEATRVGRLLMERPGMPAGELSGWFVVVIDENGTEIERIPLAALPTE